MELLASASNWLQGLHQSVNSRLVTVQPTNDAGMINVPARIGETKWELESSDGKATTWESRDFLIAVTDIYGKPDRGWQIIEPIESGGFATYEVNAPPGEQAAPFDDRFHQIYRVHSKLIGIDR